MSDTKLIQLILDKVTALDKKFTGRIDKLDKKFTGRFDEMDKKLTKRIDTLGLFCRVDPNGIASPR